MGRIRWQFAVLLVVSYPAELEAQATGRTARDSAGVQIVTFDGAMVPAQFELHHTGLDLGTEAGSELVRVSSALRMPNGAILVADGGRRHLLRFGKDGSFERVIGRDGQGPGEFERLGWMGRHSRDLAGTYDFGQARYSVFADSGFIRQVRLQSSPDVRFVEIQPLGVLPDGSMVVTGGRAIGLGAEGPARRFRMMSPVVLFGPDGAPRRLIGRYPGLEIEVDMVKNGRAAGSFANDVPLFGRSSALGMSQGHVLVVDTDRFQFEVIDTAGRQVRSVRRAVANPLVQPSHVQAFITERINATRPQFRESVREDLESKQHPPTFPALSDQLIVDAAERIWVGEYRRPGDREQAWWIFTVDGRMVGRVNVPVNLTITDAGPDWVLGTWRGQDDVLTVRLYDLRAAAGRG